MSLPSPADRTQPIPPAAPPMPHPEPPEQPEFNPEPLAASLPMPSADDDPLAEWSQRVLAGMKRMSEDPEYRASIEKRIF